MKSLLLTLLLFLTLAGILSAQTTKILIAYYSASGSTEALAQSVAKGAESVSGVEVKLLPLDKIQVTELLEADGIILGSPVYNGNVAPKVQEFINSWPFEGRPMQDKIGAAFATGGGISIGEEAVLLNMLHSMMICGMIPVGGDSVESAYGASAITGEGPFHKEPLDPIFLAKGFGLGKRVAEISKIMSSPAL